MDTVHGTVRFSLPPSRRGYRSVTHSGGAFGHLTEFQLYPDVELGVYMTINGVCGYYDCKALIIQYIGASYPRAGVMKWGDTPNF